jgi:uncharacterized protein with NRDE domain
MDQYVEELTNFTEEERATHRDYAGFNLMLISMAEEDGTSAPPQGSIVRPPRMALVTNSGGGGVLSARWLSEEETRLGGVSNGIDGSTMHLWTKVKQGQDALASAIQRPHHSEEELCENLFSVLSSVIPFAIRRITTH